jgi:predicted anti-sigma-YlaC factor YlaD
MRGWNGPTTAGERDAMVPSREPAWFLLLAAALVAALLSGCSLRRLAARQLAGALAASGSTWSADDDPALVGEALPFALKTHESLLAELPEDAALLVATCRGFASYAAGWVEAEAERLEAESYAAAEGVRRRALALHLRARGYCLRALEQRRPGAGAALGERPESALVWATAADVELLYWTGVAWGSAISLGLDRPELVADLPAVRALLRRALELAPGWDRGTLHEAMIAVESVSEILGGSPERARRHFESAVELSRGERAGPYVAYARGVLVARQDRRGFREALERALAVDVDAAPADRLANLLAQERARRLLARTDELFFAEEE